MEITKDKVIGYTVSGEFDIQASFSEDEEAKKAGDSKAVTLRFKMVNTPLSEIIGSSLKDKRINVQTSLRKHPELYTVGQIITLDYKGGKSVADPEDVMAARLKAMTPEARAKWFADRGIKL